MVRPQKERAEGVLKSVEDYGGWTRPGVQMISFAELKKGDFTDSGGSQLKFDPERQTLSNPITQLWCRPGDEAKIRQLSGMDARETEQKLAAEARNAWRPEKDITVRWRQVWKTNLVARDRGRYSVEIADSVLGEEPVIFATAPNKLVKINAAGRILMQSPIENGHGDLLVIGRKKGKAVVAEFSTWSHALRARDAAGKFLWAFDSVNRGINWVASVAIDAKDSGFAIGFVGGSIEFLGPDGKIRWKKGLDGNIWSISAARLSRTGPQHIVCVSRDGAIAFDIAGNQTQSYGPEDIGCVAAADLDSDSVDEILTLGTTVASGLNVGVFWADGKRKWSSSGKDSGLDVAFLEGKPFVVGDFGSGTTLGVATSRAIRFFEPGGKLLGDFDVREEILAVASLPQSGKHSVLIIRTRKELRCYELRQ